MKAIATEIIVRATVSKTMEMIWAVKLKKSWLIDADHKLISKLRSLKAPLK